MNRPSFNFDGGGIAEKYDEILVPVMFDPWADLLLEEVAPDPAWRVLDLATGTGIVAHKVASLLSKSGSLICTDISPDMLGVARQKLGKAIGQGQVSFQQASADQLALDDEEIDIVYCQQGFQFFPDHDAAAAEISRVLKPGGKAAVATWCSVAECEFFQLIVDCLEEMGLSELASKMRIPFDHMPAEKLENHFQSAGFGAVEVRRLTDELVFEQGTQQAYRTVYGTPIGPDLVKLEDEAIDAFKQMFAEGCEDLTSGDVTRCEISSLLMVARK